MGTLAGVILLRTMGVSLLFAGFIEHGRALGGDTRASAIAFAAYPLALALFMLPLGALSDRIGRRPVLLGVLAVSAVGGVIAAFADDVVLLGFGRFVQGAGAVNAVAIALVAEVGAPDERTRRMALLGAAAGLGFAIGIVVGAWLTPFVGVPGLLLGHSAATLLLAWPLARAPMPAPARGGRVRLGARTLALGGAAFAVNASLTGLLFLSPLLIRGVPYALAVTLMLIPGGVGMFLTSRMADRGHALAVGVAGAALLGLGPLAFLGATPPALLIGAGALYFIGHSALSSLLPSLTAATAAEGAGGTAQGVQATLQYLGSFVGASLVGALYPAALPLALTFAACGALAALAVAFAVRLR